jgi:hypothetical protein
MGTSACLFGVSHARSARDDNRCATSESLSMSSLSGEANIGFRMGSQPDVSHSYHWQSIQRVRAGDGRYLVATRSFPPPPYILPTGLTYDPGPAPMFVVVDMASRAGSGPWPWGSNYVNISTHPVKSLMGPPASDVIVRSILEDPGFYHAGGAQILGDMLAIGVEGSTGSRVAFFDMAAPLAPVRTGTLDTTAISGTGAAAAVGITKLRDGRFFMVVAGRRTRTLYFYLSTTTNLFSTAWTHFDTMVEPTIGTIGTWRYWQNLQFVTDCDGGKLRLVATSNTSDLGDGAAEIGLGDDWVEVYDVHNASYASNKVRLTKMYSHHMYCDGHCSFLAGAGPFVDGVGRMHLYGIEHDNDGPANSVKAREFKNLR